MENTEINQEQMAEILKSADAVLIDVRETFEFRDFNIGGINIPAHLIDEHLEELKPFNTLIIACSNGTRSGILTRVFRKKLPDKLIYHLEEGIF